MNKFITQLINEPYLIIIPVLIALGGFYGYLVNIKKNEIAVKINNSLFLVLTGLLSIIGVFIAPTLLNNLKQSLEVSSNAVIFSIIPFVVLIITWTLFIKEIIKTKNKVK